MRKEGIFKYLHYFGKLRYSTILGIQPPCTSISRFKRQVQSGSLEVISIPTFFYPSVLLGKKTVEDSER